MLATSTPIYHLGFVSFMMRGKKLGPAVKASCLRKIIEWIHADIVLSLFTGKNTRYKYCKYWFWITFETASQGFPLLLSVLLNQREQR